MKKLKEGRKFVEEGSPHGETVSGSLVLIVVERGIRSPIVGSQEGKGGSVAVPEESAKKGVSECGSGG